MPPQPNATRQRLIRTAQDLFAAQGVTATTTKQIAELAEVNEVTLFRHFGSKHGLLLAVIEEAAVLTQLGQTLVQQANQTDNLYQVLKDYATACLEALDRVPEVVRSIVGEAGNFPAINRQALGQGFTQANHYVAEYFATVIERGQLRTHLPAEKLASLLNGMLLGYTVIEFTSEFHNLWRDRNDFLENLVTLFLHGAVSVESSVESTEGVQLRRSAVSNLAEINPAEIRPAEINPAEINPAATAKRVADLPAELVHLILKRAKKAGLQDYALAYVLFAAGLSPTEIVQLQRSHYIHNSQQQWLQISQRHDRAVPINQWTLGKRYGSYSRNPLTQWLKSRKDAQAALFLGPTGKPLSEGELAHYWQTWTADLQTPQGQPLEIQQAQQTWCVEMLSRGMSVEHLCILTDWSAAQWQPYVERVQEKAALEQAIQLDQKPQ